MQACLLNVSSVALILLIVCFVFGVFFLRNPQTKMEECGEMSPALPLSHGPTPSQTALQHTQLMLTGSQLAGVRRTWSAVLTDSGFAFA